MLALQAARQIDLSHEHVARVNVAVVIAIVQAAATAAAEIALAIIVSSIVRPTRIEFVHAGLLRIRPGQAGHQVRTELRLG
jgi:hypothetical protein